MSIKPTHIVLFLSIALSLTSTATAQKQPAKKKKVNPAMAKVEDVAGLPRVLLIGDSISIGYTVPTRDLLRGKANVHRPPINCGPTTQGISQIDNWLATGGKDKKWDVIHFNWGLHDLKYMGPNGDNLANPDDKDSGQQVPPDEYRKNLTTLVERLQKTGAHLIWRTTTPVPEGAEGRIVGDSAKYNAIAAGVMTAAGVETHDLFTFSNTEHAKNPIMLKANVHYSKSGSAKLATDVARVIEAALVKSE